MAKKQNINNNDPISKAVDLLLENTEDLTTVFKEGGLYKELTKRLVEKMLNSEMQNYLGYEKNQHKTYSVIKFFKSQLIILKFIL